MESKQSRSRWIMFLSVVAVVVLSALFVNAGKLEPNQPPGPTMKTLQEVYDAASSGINEREGHIQHIGTEANTSEDILTVQAGKRFVLLRLNLWFAGSSHAMPNWYLAVNGTPWLRGYITYAGYNGGIVDTAIHDFPDRCLVVNAGETLTIVNTQGIHRMDTQIIGYFYNVP
jgi:hypothetical protein